MLDCAAAPSAAVSARGATYDRKLLVLADDFGIGPATNRGILELGLQGRITGSVLLVNSPFAEEAVRSWHGAGRPMELGWHPCLTLDRPILSARQVPSLVDREGRFWRLRAFLQRWALGRLRAEEVAAEWHAQYDRFAALTGGPPALVTTHQHVQVLPPVGKLLLDVLARQRPRPYVRRVVESWSMLACIPGAWVKRGFLTLLGRRHAAEQTARGFPGNDCLIGVTNPHWVRDRDYLARRLRHASGEVVELVTHPGYFDPTLAGRDCTPQDGLQQRRVDELRLLRDVDLPALCAAGGWRLAAPSEIREISP